MLTSCSPRYLSVEQEDTNVWDESPDSEKNIRYNISKPGLVAGATFNKLVERVTSEKDHGTIVCTISTHCNFFATVPLFYSVQFWVLNVLV